MNTSTSRNSAERMQWLNKLSSKEKLDEGMAPHCEADPIWYQACTHVSFNLLLLSLKILTRWRAHSLSSTRSRYISAKAGLNKHALLKVSMSVGVMKDYKRIFSHWVFPFFQCRKRGRACKQEGLCRACKTAGASARAQGTALMWLCATSLFPGLSV